MDTEHAFMLKHGISRRSYLRGMTDEEERDRARWQLYKMHAPETPEIAPSYDAEDLAKELEALPPTQQRLLEMAAEHLPDPPKRGDNSYPKYDARRLKDPNKLRRSSGMPLNRMRKTIRQTYDEVLEKARCKRYAIEMGLDYADGKPFTTPKPFNKLAYLLERKRFGGKPISRTGKTPEISIVIPIELATRQKLYNLGQHATRSWTVLTDMPQAA